MNEMEKLDKLAAILDHRPSKNRYEVNKALRRLEELITTSTDLAVAALKHPSWEIRYHTVWGLKGVQDLNLILPLLDACHNQRDFIRTPITIVIGKMGVPAYDSLFAALKHPKGYIRSLAAETLSRQGDPVAIAAVADALDMIPYSSWESIAFDPNWAKGIKAPLIEKIKQKLSHHNPKVRDRATLTLVHVGWVGQWEFLISSLDSPNILVRLEAAKVISKYRSKYGKIPTIEPVLSRVDDADSEVQRYLIEAIGSQKDPQAIPLLIGLLYKSNTDMGWVVSDAITKIGTAAIDPVKALLDDPNPQIRQYAYSILGRLKADDPDLWLRAFNEIDFDTRQKGIKHLAVNVSWETLISNIGYPDDQIRFVIASELGSRLAQYWKPDRKGYLREIFELIEHPDPAIRTGAILVLRRGSQNLQLLVRNPNIRADVDEVSAHYRNIKSLDNLQRCLNDSDANVRMVTIVALGRLRHPRAIKPLVPFLHDPDPTVRLATIEALMLIHYPDVIEALIPLLQDPDPNVQTAAAEALRSFASPDAQRAYKRWKRGKPIVDNPTDSAPST